MPNRRDRRAQQSSTTSSSAPETPSTIPGSMRASDDPRNHSSPNSTTTSSNGKTKAKTLLEIAAERQAIQSHLLPAGATLKESNVVNVTIDPDGTVRSLDGSALPERVAEAVARGKDGKGEGTDAVNDVEEIPPLLDTLLLSLPLSAVHFTLAVLAMHQFALEVKFGQLAWETGLRAFPALTLLVHLFRGHLLGVGKFRMGEDVRRWVVLGRGLVYLVVANVAGCYLLTLTNGRGYYAAVKHAPGVGTLWVWAVLEMGLVGAVGGVTGPAVFAWWHGYGF